MPIAWEGFRRASGKSPGIELRRDVVAYALTFAWFGLLAGWLEIALIRARGAIDPQVTPEMIRTSRHVVWMVPLADALMLAAVGLLLAPLLGLFRRRIGWWVALRLPVAMSVLTLLLNVEGLYTVAALVLACGCAAVAGRWLGRRADGFARLVRKSLPALAATMIATTALTYLWVASAERRTLAASPPAEPGAPNVLLVVLDTVRASCLSLYGHYRPTSPNLERLARRGLVFTEARATAPWTSPTHASIMTGRWPHELSVGPNLPLDGTFPTLAETLDGRGYATAGFVGNIYYCDALHGLARGFGHYEDAYENQAVSPFEALWSTGLGRRVVRGLGYSTQLDDGVTLRRKSAEMINRDVLGWLSDRPADRPFFAFINYYDAHRPFVLGGEPEQRFGMAGLPTAEQQEIDGRFQAMLAGKGTPPGFSPDRVNRDGVTLCHDSYDSCIADLDRQFGLLVDEMERRGLLDNTLVIVTSDHGEQIGEHGLITHGASVHREEVHVPLVVIPPGSMRGAGVVREPVSLREIPATVAEWAGLGPQSPFPGHPLTRFLRADAGSPPEESPVLSEVEHNIVFPPPMAVPFPFGPARSLVARNRLYIRRGDGGEELYDTVNDPLELVNLADDPRSRPAIERFRDELVRVCGDRPLAPRW